MQPTNNHKITKDVDKIYKFRPDNTMYEANIYNEVLPNGLTVGQLLKEHGQLQMELSLANRDLEVVYFKGGVQDQDINKVKIVHPDVTYHCFIVDEQGYILEVDKTMGRNIEEYIELPEDICSGYYKLSNGEVVIDEVKKINMHSIL